MCLSNYILMQLVWVILSDTLRYVACPFTCILVAQLRQTL